MSNHPAFDIVTSLDAELLQLERSRLTLPARVALEENRAAAATYEAAAAGVSADLAPLAEKIRAPAPCRAPEQIRGRGADADGADRSP